MSTHRWILLAVMVPLIANADADSPHLGEPLTQAEVEAHSFTVLPDGEGLPTGSGTVAAGEIVYQQQCAACHGENGENGPNDRLAGGQGTIDSDAPVKTIGSYWPYATTVFDYVRRAMPYNAPGSLSNDDIYAVTAYLLYLNGIVSEGMVIDAATLPQVKMPNRDNFDWAWQP